MTPRTVAMWFAVGALAASGAVAAPAGAATSAATPFSCTGSVAPARAYTKQTVTGTLDGSGTLHDAKVINYQGVVQVSVASPRLDNTYWNGYWKTTYGYNQWALGTGGQNTYHFMVGSGGASFNAVLLTEFGPNGVNGNWQNRLSCTSS